MPYLRKVFTVSVTKDEIYVIFRVSYNWGKFGKICVNPQPNSVKNLLVEHAACGKIHVYVHEWFVEHSRMINIQKNLCLF